MYELSSVNVFVAQQHYIALSSKVMAMNDP